MYRANPGYGPMPTFESMFPNPRNFNIESQSYFRSLEYKVASVQPLYRSQAYLSMFDSGAVMPSYAGMPSMVSPLERYLTRNAVNMQMEGEYLRNMQIQSYMQHQEYAPITSGIIHIPEIFLVPGRPQAEFIENITPALKKNIRMIFQLTTGEELPESILISVLHPEDLQREHGRHSRHWSSGIQGFAINRQYDVSSVFAKQNPLDSLLLTIGHEIGHCLSPPKEDIVLEEAKAFAFELAWMKTIHRFNILGLRDSMNLDMLNPAINGVHNVALDFVIRKVASGNDPLSIFKKIAKSQQFRGTKDNS
jgi:hypothetical protein